MTTTDDILKEFREQFTVNQESMQIMFNYRSGSDTREMVVATISDIEQFIKEALERVREETIKEVLQELEKYGWEKGNDADIYASDISLRIEELKANKSEEKECYCQRHCAHDGDCIRGQQSCEHCKEA